MMEQIARFGAQRVRALALVALALLLISARAGLAAPSIFWASDPVGADEAALIVGDQLGDAPRIEMRRLPDEPSLRSEDSSDAGPWVAVAALQASSQSVKFVVPKQFEPGVFAYRLTTSHGTATGYLNAPTVYWAQGDQGVAATPGGWVRVFGRCIAQGPRAALSLSRAGGGSWLLRPKIANLWDASFDIPADIPVGSFRLRLWNGTGDAEAWRDAGTLEIRPAAARPAAVFNVRNFGAAGNGLQDDTAAIEKALEAAGAKGGGTVLFPRGRYLLSEMLSVPRFVTLRGERRDLVNLAWRDFETPPPALIQGSSDFALQDLTLYASNHFHIVSGGFVSVPGVDAGRIRIERVTIRASIYRGHLKPEEVDRRWRENLKATGDGADTIQLSGEDLVITDSDLYGSARSLFLQRPRGAYVARNKFYNGRWGWYSISGADGVIFEDNEIIGADLMATGGGINNLRGNARSQNVLFLRNKFSLMHGWDREAMTSDAGGGFYYGRIERAEGRTIVLADAPSRSPSDLGGWRGAGVFILGGKGMGQLAQVERIDGRSVILDRPWKVPPDRSSVLTITMLQQNYLFIDNQFSDAGVAIQFYGTSVDHVVAGNTSTRTGGFFNSGRWYRHYQPSWYIQFLGNRIAEGNVYRSGSNNAVFSGEAVLGSMGYQRAPNTAPLALGAVLRRNVLESNAHIEVTGVSAQSPGIRDVVVEGNTVENADLGVTIDAGAAGVLVRANRFRGVTLPVRDLSGGRPAPN